MGKNSSSETRVKPLMSEIGSDPEKFAKLLSLVQIDERRSFSEKILKKVESEKLIVFYTNPEKNKKEIALPQSPEYLIALVDLIVNAHVSQKKSSDSESRKKRFNREKRNALFSGCEEVIDEAKKIIGDDKKEKWAIFENPTYPDAFIETDSSIFIIEGKRTERHTTIKTTWTDLLNQRKGSKDKDYFQRDQMVRHIQGALYYAAQEKNESERKKVYAFYIVCENFPDRGIIDSRKDFEDTIDKEIPFVQGLKEDICKSYYGYTTWERMKDAFRGINFPDTVEKQTQL